MKPRPLSLSAALILGTVVCGLALRLLRLGLPTPVVKYGGSVLWALMIFWIVSTLLPTKPLRLEVLASAAVCTLVECFKLYHTPRLDAFRLTLPGALLLGRFFSIEDLVAYGLALAAGALVDSRLRAMRRQPGSDSDA